MVIKSIVRQQVDLSRVIYKDTQSYFGIMVDNLRGTFCRLFFNGKVKHITTIDESKKEVRHNIESLDDIYKFSEDILRSLKLKMEE